MDRTGPSRAPDGPNRRLGPPYQVKRFDYCSPHDGNGIVYSLGLDKRSGQWKNPVVCAVPFLAGGAISPAVGGCAVVDQFGGKTLHPSGGGGGG